MELIFLFIQPQNLFEVTEQVLVVLSLMEERKFDCEASGKSDSLTKPNPSYHGISFTQTYGAAAFVTKGVQFF